MRVLSVLYLLAAILAGFLLVWAWSWRNVGGELGGGISFDASSDSDRRLVEELFIEALIVLRSREFSQAIATLHNSHPVTYFNPGSPRRSTLEINNVLFEKSRNKIFLPPIVRVVGRDRGDGSPYWATTTYMDNYSAIWMGYAKVEDYNSSDVVLRSCAINAAAHELSHTISSSSQEFVIVDTGVDVDPFLDRQGDNVPIASYLIGATAQCVYLRRAGRISPPDLLRCVEVFGVSKFNSARCYEFSDGRSVGWEGLSDEVAP